MVRPSAPLHLVGFSLSFCVSDILRGLVSLDAVSTIIASTACEDTATWDLLWEEYRSNYWGGDARGVEIAKTLIQSGKILQPRLQGIPAHTLFNGHWFKSTHDWVHSKNFSRDDVTALLAQHTAESGQTFEPEAYEAIWYWTQGQPYLVNKLADFCAEELTNCDPAIPISAAMVQQAKESLIQARTTHLDDLVKRLKQTEIKKVIQNLLVGDPSIVMGRTDPEVELTMDLGLVAWSPEEGFHIANPIYREVLPRVLNYGMQIAVPPAEFVWKNADGTLDMDALLKEFQKFWKRHSDTWESKADYTEAFPHLLLMAFLQRILNGGGRITREYAAGRGRMDLYVEFAGQGFVIEIKLVHPGDGKAATLEEALTQVSRYRAIVGDRNTPTYIALFDRTPPGRKLSWEERLTWDVVETEGGPVAVMGA